MTVIKEKKEFLIYIFKHCEMIEQTFTYKEGIFCMNHYDVDLDVVISSGRQKAKDISAIDIHELTTIAHYFIIASGTSVPHIKAIADNVKKAL